MMKRFLLSLVATLIAIFPFVSASAQPQAAPLTIRLQPFLSGLSSPVLITSAKDGTRRLFVVQQGGIIKVVQPGSNVATDFMNITTRVLSGGERGLLGLAFHPNFASNGYFFVNYTRQTDGATVVSRFTAINNNTQGEPNSEVPLLTIPQPFSNHNGGMIAFRTDNGVHNLYIGMGDGGSGNDPGNRSQNINDLLGKFLRITPSVAAMPPVPAYTVPSDNPYVGVNGADEIYAVGVRNPWRWSFDRGGTNQLWAGDVGQGAIEEVDIITRGGNLGWRVYEGTQCTNLDPGLCTPTNFVAPVFEYSSAGAGNPRCSVTGGYVYRGNRRTFPNGAYVYADYCSGEILLWENNQQRVLLDTSRLIASFGEDDDGEIYVVGLGGTIEKIVRAKAPADFDGDLRTDISVFRPSNGTWYINNSSNGSNRFQGFGLNGDVPVPEDYDGDNTTDIAVFRPSTGVWYAFLSQTNSVAIYQFGTTGDVPAGGDFDGDGRADLSVYRPSSNVWYVQNSGSVNISVVPFGLAGDVPAAGDFDGDGRTDISIFRPSTGTWWFQSSLDNTLRAVRWGASGDMPVHGDYDGDGRTDRAVFRAGVWYILQSSNGATPITQWGLATDIPVPGDYDGDGRTDIAVFRPSNGVWYIVRSSNSSSIITQYGLGDDLPAPAYDRR